MKYKLIVLDLDGTLTNSKKEITPRNRETLIRMQEQGIRLVLASGRPTYGIVPLANELRMHIFSPTTLQKNFFNLSLHPKQPYMKYKLIVLDLDGTLTNSKKEITPRNRETLIRMQEQGIRLVLASGRPTYCIVPLANELRMNEFG